MIRHSEPMREPISRLEKKQVSWRHSYLESVDASMQCLNSLRDNIRRDIDALAYIRTRVMVDNKDEEQVTSNLHLHQYEWLSQQIDAKLKESNEEIMSLRTLIQYQLDVAIEKPPFHV